MLAQGRGFFPMDHGLTQKELRKIATDPKKPWHEQVAAFWLAESMPPDMKDYEMILTGDETLEEAARRGVRTDSIKKMKRRTFTKDDGTQVTEVELELHDRALEAINMVHDRAYGRPAVTVQGGDKPIAIAALHVPVPAACLDMVKTNPKAVREIINGIAEQAAREQKRQEFVDGMVSGNGQADK